MLVGGLVVHGRKKQCLLEVFRDLLKTGMTKTNNSWIEAVDRSNEGLPLSIEIPSIVSLVQRDASASSDPRARSEKKE